VAEIFIEKMNGLNASIRVYQRKAKSLPASTNTFLNNYDCIRKKLIKVDNEVTGQQPNNVPTGLIPKLKTTCVCCGHKCTDGILYCRCGASFCGQACQEIHNWLGHESFCEARDWLGEMYRLDWTSEVDIPNATSQSKQESRTKWQAKSELTCAAKEALDLQRARKGSRLSLSPFEANVAMKDTTEGVGLRSIQGEEDL
jgi:hypothetical protein